MPLRSSGAVVGTNVGNPFYSQGVQESIAIRAARPKDLPPTPVVEMLKQTQWLLEWGIT